MWLKSQLKALGKNNSSDFLYTWLSANCIFTPLKRWGVAHKYRYRGSTNYSSQIKQKRFFHSKIAYFSLWMCRMSFRAIHWHACRQLNNSIKCIRWKSYGCFIIKREDLYTPIVQLVMVVKKKILRYYCGWKTQENRCNHWNYVRLIFGVYGKWNRKSHRYV